MYTEQINLSSKNPASTNVILDVGGWKYQLSLQSIRMYPDTLLAQAFNDDSSCPFEITEDGDYYIERNGRIFRAISDFYRFGRWPINWILEATDLGVTADDLVREFQYFGIPPTCKQ